MSKKLSVLVDADGDVWVEVSPYTYALLGQDVLNSLATGDVSSYQDVDRNFGIQREVVL